MTTKKSLAKKNGNTTKALALRFVAPESMTELRTLLSQAIGARVAGKIDSDLARDIGNLSGKLIKTAVSQYEYAHHRGEKAAIPFMR